MPTDALSLAMLGPTSAEESVGVGTEGETDDAAMVAEGVLAAIEAKDASGLAAAMRDLMDVIRAEAREGESMEDMED